MPLSLNSAPIASPRLRMSDLDQVAAALIPAGKTEFKSAERKISLAGAHIKEKNKVLVVDVLYLTPSDLFLFIT